MSEETRVRSLPLPHLKFEGAPIHPDDLTYECYCEKCLAHRVRQRQAYNDWHRARDKDWKDE